MSMEIALETFFNESREMLENMEHSLLQFEGGLVDDIPEGINAIFRAAHTIKGSAGIFGLDLIVDFTHVVENILDQLRDDAIKLDSALISLLLHCQDHIGVLLNEAEGGVDDTSESSVQSQFLMGELEKFSVCAKENEKESSAGKEKTGTSVAMARYSEHLASDKFVADRQKSDSFERLAEDAVDSDNWHISLRFGEDAFRDGMDPLSFFSYLNGIGRIVSVIPLSSNFPQMSDFDPESCYLGFEIQFSSQASKQTIEDVFEFMREDGEVRILAPHSALGDFLQLIESMPELDLRLGEILIECGALTKAELQAALACQKKLRAENRQQPLGEILSAADTRLSPVLEAAVQKQSKVRQSLAKEQKSLRVDADKLDTLIKHVGELVTAGAGTALLAEALGNSNLIESISVLNDLLEEVRDAALKLRMVPVGSTFSRFQRVVRDMANEMEKDVELIITGAETELDKSVVEKIGDPLLHLVRNAMDHGIETASLREACNKPVKGRLALNAYHDSGNIVIEVSDDGKGLDPEALRVKAIEKGLISEEAVLSRDELLNLIFEPGFSTAAQISSVSGRGVGMDVVRRNIADLRGRIEIDSELKRGTTFRIMLPLTLAIIDGFLIGIGDESFVVPLDLVQECVELDISDLCRDAEKAYINLRGQILPLIDLRSQFELGGLAPARQSVVVVKAGNQLMGLVVDRLMGELQTVIKPLGKLFDSLAGLSGSTILGNGAVALILDIQGLMDSMLEGDLSCSAIAHKA